MGVETTQGEAAIRQQVKVMLCCKQMKLTGGEECVTENDQHSLNRPKYEPVHPLSLLEKVPVAGSLELIGYKVVEAHANVTQTSCHCSKFPLPEEVRDFNRLFDLPSMLQARITKYTVGDSGSPCRGMREDSPSNGP